MALSLSELDEMMAVAQRLADVAGPETLRHFRQGRLSADNKAGSGAYDPVTLADRAAEAAMRRLLAQLRPEDGILGEEEAPKAGTSGRTWVIDPIDGTRSYVAGSPVWGILIALDAGAGPVLGLVDQPFTGERFFGHSGRAFTTRHGARREIHTRPCRSLGDAVLFSTFPEVGTPEQRAAFERVRSQVRLTRYGLDCYAYALVAMGEIDLVIEAGLKAYDIQGPQALIEAAGGVVTSWQGGPCHMGGTVIAAGDRGIHRAALEILNAG